MKDIKNYKKWLKYTVHLLNLSDLNFVQKYLKIWINSFDVGDHLDFGTFVNETW